MEIIATALIITVSGTVALGLILAAVDELRKRRKR
jgi:hypothetical protein